MKHFLSRVVTFISMYNELSPSKNAKRSEQCRNVECSNQEISDEAKSLKVNSRHDGYKAIEKTESV